MEYYVVTAVSGEQNLSCGYTDFTYNCRIPPGKSVNEFNFTVYGIAQGINGVLYNGNSSTDCCEMHTIVRRCCMHTIRNLQLYIFLGFPFPNVRIFEKDCGFLVKMQVSWNVSLILLNLLWKNYHHPREVTWSQSPQPSVGVGSIAVEPDTMREVVLKTLIY